MNTLESTVSMLEILPDEDVQAIYSITKMFFEKEKNPFKPISKKQVLKDLELSRQQIANGDCADMKSAISAIRDKYASYMG